MQVCLWLPSKCFFLLLLFLLLEFGDASNLDENDSKHSESEEEGEFASVGDRLNCYSRRVGNWRFRYNS